MNRLNMPRSRWVAVWALPISGLLWSAHCLAADAEPESPGVIQKVEHAVRRGAEAAAHGVERGAEATKRGLQRAASATAHGAQVAASGVARGAKAAAQGVETAAHKVTGSGSAASSSSD